MHSQFAANLQILIINCAVAIHETSEQTYGIKKRRKNDSSFSSHTVIERWYSIYIHLPLRRPMSSQVIFSTLYAQKVGEL